MASGKQQWGGLFKIVSRAYLKELAEAEVEKPDRYVYEPATGKEKVEINDFESTALDFFEPKQIGQKDWDGVTEYNMELPGVVSLNAFASSLGVEEAAMRVSRFNPPTRRTRNEKEKYVADAEVACAQHGKAFVDLFEGLPPSQQDVLLCLKEYGTKVSWSQVTPAAPENHGQQGKPWNSLDGVLSPEAALATSLILEEYMAEMLRRPSPDTSSGSGPPARPESAAPRPDDEMAP